jgi:hypothetical protein
MVLEHVVAPAEPREIAGFGGAAEDGVVRVIEVQLAGFDAAAGEPAT